MSETKRLALIQLCGTHKFSESKLENSPNKKFVTCENCPLEWGEIEDTKRKFPILVTTIK